MSTRLTTFALRTLFVMSLLFGLGGLSACAEKTEAPPPPIDVVAEAPPAIEAATEDAPPEADAETEDAPPATDTEAEDTPPAAETEETPPVIETISVEQLTPEAQQTLTLIYQGGPFPYSRDGIVFGNREKLLPINPYGYYREHTVPTPGVKTRGARRIVCGGEKPPSPDVCYYTADHYQSFQRIRNETVQP